ncbi:Phage/plasmid primase, P4 family [Methylorubrum extorquens]|uniref:Phage/plasmid primase, P4 family n=1 Tax=Methylorubrum extorquens TaxID=408 RepID=A0A2N9AJS8_METEX|nr:phage/plasmid primase, P4 family [Methylobacterium sp. Leaf122]KQQ19565.1 hypothetical protein ASF56_21775 [Methylobacterium sp. Leaf122]SOR27583.1 Phage/plasmid primase, P4 family [Methylorubrum extorquens]
MRDFPSFDAELDDLGPEPESRWPGYGNDEPEPKRKLKLDHDGEPLNQDSAAQAFAQRYAGRLLYCHDSAKWYEWTGAAWEPNRCGIAFQWSRELIRELFAEKSDRTRYIASKVEFAGGVEKYCRHDPALAVTIEGWDADPWLLGTPGGTVDLRTGDLHPADPAERITKLTAVAPAEAPNCPNWLRFLNDVTQGDAGYIRFLQQWAGYCLTGDTSEQALCFAFGGGGNGKGVLIHVLAGILKDYAVNAAMETFTASKHDRHPTEIAALRGARLVTASETEQGRQWAEARIKQLTGGDTMRARYMRQDEFEFTPVLKLLIIGNNKPGLSNVDDAARRRFNLLPFLFKPAVPDPRLEEKLRAEWPAILRWMIEGCLDWQTNRLVRPDVVKVATDEYFSAQDTFSLWLEERCVVDRTNPYRKATTQELFASWSEYARANNEPPGTQTSFGERMEKLGFKKKEKVATGVGTRARGYEGVELRPPSQAAGQ